MKIILFKISIGLLLFTLMGCNQKKKELNAAILPISKEIKYAKGFKIDNYNRYSVLRITNTWPESKQIYTYILQEKNAKIPDSLKSFTLISVPIKKIVVTSTTHIPALELLGVEKTLIGFPSTDFISSIKTRALIDARKVREVGKNENLNTEILIDLAPDVIIGFGLNNINPTLDNLQKSGLKVIFNGDWNEKTPLAKAEWIKLFGALYGLETKANQIFSEIETAYKSALTTAKKASNEPTVLCGSQYQNQWFVPQGNSWAAQFLKDAHSNYLWKNTNGTGSLSLSFETVLDKAKMAEFWISPGDFVSLKEMSDSNFHYKEFQAFKNKKVYSYALNKGKKGGILYFEWSCSRPDWVLKDFIKILHPELLPNYKTHFFNQLN